MNVNKKVSSLTIIICVANNDLNEAQGQTALLKGTSQRLIPDASPFVVRYYFIVPGCSFFIAVNEKCGALFDFMLKPGTSFILKDIS